MVGSDEVNAAHLRNHETNNLSAGKESGGSGRKCYIGLVAVERDRRGCDGGHHGDCWEHDMKDVPPSKKKKAYY